MSGTGNDRKIVCTAESKVVFDGFRKLSEAVVIFFPKVVASLPAAAENAALENPAVAASPNGAVNGVQDNDAAAGNGGPAHVNGSPAAALNLPAVISPPVVRPESNRVLSQKVPFSLVTERYISALIIRSIARSIFIA